MKISREEFRDALLKAGAKSIASANGLTTRLFKKREEIDAEEVSEYYTGSKSRFASFILEHFGLTEDKISPEEEESKKMLSIMFSGKEVPKFKRKLGENDFELIERFCIEKENKKPKMAGFCAKKAVDENNRVKVTSKYFALCRANE